MSGGLLADREKACKTAIQNNYLNNKLIWKKLLENGQISILNAPQYCANGGNFRIDYGFDERPKSWQFTQFVVPSCSYPCLPTFN